MQYMYILGRTNITQQNELRFQSDLLLELCSSNTTIATCQGSKYSNKHGFRNEGNKHINSNTVVLIYNHVFRGMYCVVIDLVFYHTQLDWLGPKLSYTDMCNQVA